MLQTFTLLKPNHLSIFQNEGRFVQYVATLRIIHVQGVVQGSVRFDAIILIKKHVV
jgi:hypothetical protein